MARHVTVPPYILRSRRLSFLGRAKLRRVEKKAAAILAALAKDTAILGLGLSVV